MSFINHQYRHVFIHVPKTAGTSMERQAWVGGNSHATARSFVPLARDYFSWGFVRHPCDRLVSVYYSACQHGGPHPRTQSYGGFADFVYRLEECMPELIHIRPQIEFLCDRTGKILVDFIGRFERLQQDWAQVCRQIGVPVLPLPRHNGSSHPPWRELYSRELLEIVRAFYATDFSVFGY